MSNGDPYEFVASGSLKIKGIGSGKIKKNKKKKKSKAEEIAELANKEKDHSSDDGDTERSSTSVKKTAAELAFEKAQEKREEKQGEVFKLIEATERILKKASKTHKQRVEELNEYLGGLSEHYDIQKVSWTK